MKLFGTAQRWLLAIVLVVAATTAGTMLTARAAACDLTATAANLNTQFASATGVKTICLTQSTDYGTFRGGSKLSMITITPDTGVTASIGILFNNVTNVTIDGSLGGGSLTIHECTTSCMGDGNVQGTSSNVTFKNARFDHRFAVNKSGSGAITVDNADFTKTVDDASIECRFCAFGEGANSVVKNSLFKDGEADGIRADGDNWTIGPGNRFVTLKDLGANHSDPIQICCGGAASQQGGDYDGPGGQHIIGNYFDQSGGTGNIVAYIGIYDSAHDVTIEDNVFRAVAGGSGGGHGVAYAIDLNSDRDSTIRHNTMERGTCDFNIPCGTIDLGHKDSDNVSIGTLVQDNVMANLSSEDGGATADHNLMRLAADDNDHGVPVFVGPNTTYEGFYLTSGSPGHGAASDHTDMGISHGDLIGDIDADSDIDADDLTILKANYGQTVTGGATAGTDLNADDKVNVKDLSILLRNWTGSP